MTGNVTHNRSYQERFISSKRFNFKIKECRHSLTFKCLFTQLQELESYREESGLTIHWRQYVLDSFVSSDITTEFLDKIRADMAIVRKAKITVVMRFMYTDVLNEASKLMYN